MTKKSKLASTVPSATEVAERPAKRVRKAKAPATETPLMRQIREAKDKHPGMLLLFQVGELCELFGEDAQVAAKVLRLPLTQREEGKDAVPTVSFPHRALEAHLSKILQAGHKVAICERPEGYSKPEKIIDTFDAGGGIMVDVVEGGEPKPRKRKKVQADPERSDLGIISDAILETPKHDPRFSWPTSPTASYCASAVSWHTWQSSCGHFQVARIVGRQGAKSGFSCQFRAEVPDGSWELVAHAKEGPTYTKLFQTLEECLKEVDKFALAKLGHASFNRDQVLEEAEKQGMAEVPDTRDHESKPSRRVAEEVSTPEVPPYVSEENTVKISKSKAVELLLAVGLPSANMKQPTKVIAKNLATLPKMEGVSELQLDDDELQKLLTQVLKDLGEDAKKGVEIVEDSPAKGSKGSGKSSKGGAKPSKNGKAPKEKVSVPTDRFGMRGEQGCAINAALGAKPLSIEKIAEKTGLKPARVKSHLQYWKKQGKGLGACLVESDKGWAVDLAKLPK